MASSEQEEFLSRLRSHLLDHSDLEPQLVLIYVLALRDGVVTSTTVSKSLADINPKSIPAKLRQLANEGYLMAAVGQGKGGTGVKSHPQPFYPLPPSQALKAKLESAHRLWEDVQRFDEEMEVGPQVVEEEMIVIPNQLTAFAQLAEGIRAASRDLLAYCRDGDWWSLPEVKDAVVATYKRGIPTTIVASAMPKATVEALRKEGITVHETFVAMTPFVLVDGATLYLAHKTGSLGNMYATLRITNKYMARGYEDFIRSVQQESP